EVQPRPRRHEAGGARAHAGVARRARARLLVVTRGDTACALAAHAPGRYLPAAARVGPGHHRADRTHYPRGDARRGPAARVGPWGTRTLHDLPGARERWPGAARAARARRSEGLGAHRRAAHRAARLPDAPAA